MILSIHPANPQSRNILSAVECLRKGGVIVYPTDTIYGLGCDIFNTEAIKRICAIKGINPKKARFSFVCNNLSHLSDYAQAIDTPTFRFIKNKVPGPYTFILNASRQVPKQLKMKKDTVGIRVPDHNITRELVTELGHPIMSISLPMDGDVYNYTDPEIIYQEFGNLVDMVIDGGTGGMIPSTVIDCTDEEPVLIREGAGQWEELST